MLTVKQFIEQLQKLNPDAIMAFSGPDSGGYDSSICPEVQIIAVEDEHEARVFITGVGEFAFSLVHDNPLQERFYADVYK